MADVTFVDDAGFARTVPIGVGTSLMEGGVLGGVPGIDADCGGVGLCATCRVVVNPDWWNRLPALSDAEQEMLEAAEDRQPNSRLSCFVKVTERLDGLVVLVPASQR